MAEGGFSFRSTTIRGAGDGSIGGGGRGAKKRPRCSLGPDSSLRLSSAEGPLPPSANTMRGARDGSVATKPANQGRAPRSKRLGQFFLNALAFGGRGVSRLRALATVGTIGERPKRKARHLRRALQFRPLPSVNRRVSTLDDLKEQDETPQYSEFARRVSFLWSGA